jgi:hypothetical protein
MSVEISETPVTPAAADPYELWAIVRQRDIEHKETEGFVITTRDRSPRLVALIDRTDAPGLLSAKLIAQGKASPESEIDLRARPGAVDRLIGTLLLPIRPEGQRGEGDCVAAAFVRVGESGIAFSVFPKGAFAAFHQAISRKDRPGTEGK